MIRNVEDDILEFEEISWFGDAFKFTFRFGFKFAWKIEGTNGSGKFTISLFMDRARFLRHLEKV